MKKLLPIFLILSILALVYGAKMYQYQDNPALNSEIENIYLEMQRGIRVKVGSFTCPAGTGNYSVTGVGFKPRYVEFIISRDLANVAWQGQGWMDYNGNQSAQSLAASNTPAMHTALSGLNTLLFENVAGTRLIRAYYVSMDSDGFTINFDTVDSSFTIFWKVVR